MSLQEAFKGARIQGSCVIAKRGAARVAYEYVHGPCARLRRTCTTPNCANPYHQRRVA